MNTTGDNVNNKQQYKNTKLIINNVTKLLAGIGANAVVFTAVSLFQTKKGSIDKLAAFVFASVVSAKIMSSLTPTIEDQTNQIMQLFSINKGE